jgi:dCMP deaminase
VSETTRGDAAGGAARAAAPPGAAVRASGAPVTRPALPPRPTWDEYFLHLARQAATRSTCLRRQVGAVMVRGHRVLSTGYNGAPRGVSHCLEVGCLRDELGIPSGERHELCRAIHAEQNAIIQAAVHGVAVEGATLYCTHQPCVLCAKVLINAGVREIYYVEGYPDDFARAMCEEAGVRLVHMDLP